MHTETQSFVSRVEHLAQANAFVTACLDRFHIDPAMEFKVLLALEEAFVNICHHAYPDNEGEIEITCSRDNDTDPVFVLEIADKGEPFDVLSLPDPDTTLSVEERPVGGLGIYLIRTLSSSATYARANNQNRLQMRFSKKTDAC